MRSVIPLGSSKTGGFSMNDRKQGPTRSRQAPFDLRKTVTFRLLGTASKLTQGFINTYSARFGIGLPEWRTLGMLGQFGPLPPIRIAELAEMDRGAISRAVAMLDRLGLVKRRKDQGHKRRQVIVLTARGRRLHAEISEFARWRHARLGELLNRTELTMLDTILNTLDEWAEELRSGHDLDPHVAATGALKAKPAPEVAATAGPSLASESRERLLLELARFKRVLSSSL
jgi:DNA-binding MarR family transcriptional regulator